MLIFQQPGSNALATADRIKAAIKDLSKAFPSGLRYDIVYDTTEYIAQSVDEVYKTIFEAVVLVVIVVFLFLQNLACLGNPDRGDPGVAESVPSPS